MAGFAAPGQGEACYPYLTLICFGMPDEAIRRLLDYDRRRYWLLNGWSIRFRVAVVVATAARPHGIQYAFTLNDVDGTRLLGFDNAHGSLARRPMTSGIAFGGRPNWCPTTFWVLTS